MSEATPWKLPSLSLRQRSGLILKMARHTSLIMAAPVIVACAFSLWWFQTRPFETTVRRAYRLCGECGLERGDITGLIDTMRHSTLTREQSLNLFYGQFHRKSDAKLCEPCANAILDASRAFVPSQ